MNSFEITGDPHATPESTGNIYTVHLGINVWLHFSYKTLIGVHVWESYGDGAAYRQKNTWGPTTGRHMKLCGLDGPHAKECTEQELYEIVRGALFRDVVAAPLDKGD